MSACALSPGATPALAAAGATSEENPASAAELRDWIDSAPITRPMKNFARDLSDGVLVAEITHYYCPRFVDLHNYAPANSRSVKTYNWMTLNAKVFRKLHFQVSKQDIEAVVACVPGAAERVLTTLRSRIEERRVRSQMRAPPTWDIRAEWGGSGRPGPAAPPSVHGECAWQASFGTSKPQRDAVDTPHNAVAYPDGRHWISPGPYWGGSPAPAGPFGQPEQVAWPPSRVALSGLATDPWVAGNAGFGLQMPQGAVSPDVPRTDAAAPLATTPGPGGAVATPIQASCGMHASSPLPSGHPHGAANPLPPASPPIQASCGMHASSPLPSGHPHGAANPLPPASPPALGEVAALREANALLEIKVQKLEALLRLKNAKIAALSSALAVAGQPQAR